MKHRRGTSAKEAKQVLRLLVLSDSHGDAGSVYRAVAAQPEAAAVLYLGDGAADFAAAAAAFPRLAFYPVRGNGDFAPDAAGLPYAREECFGGKRFFLTHGHLYGVKTDPLRVVYAARERGADVLLYGHTHRPLTDYEDGLHILNPGSLRAGGTYGVVDLSDAGVVLNIVRCRS